MDWETGLKQAEQSTDEARHESAGEYMTWGSASSMVRFVEAAQALCGLRSRRESRTRSMVG